MKKKKRLRMSSVVGKKKSMPIPPAPSCRAATLPAVEERMGNAFPPLSHFRNKESKSRKKG